MKYRFATSLLLLAACAPQVAGVAGPPVLVLPEPGVDRALGERVERVVATRRPLRPLRALPPRSRSPKELGTQHRIDAIAAALGRARRHEEVAAWDACAKEAGDRLGLATEVLASTNRIELLRDLHLQIGACLSLSNEPANAQPHFRVATLLDEAPPPSGAHREEAEGALEVARSEVLARAKGPLRIETVPPGAEVWLDGRRVGVTPLSVDVRLGEHFVTLRRFRFEPQTNHALVQPRTRVRFVLSPARTETLRQQLAEVKSGRQRVPLAELRLARASWSEAEQLLELDKRGTLRLISVGGAKTLRRGRLAPDADDDEVRESVCGVLGEQCEDGGGIPWYVWPIAGLAVVGGAIGIGFLADSQRSTRFCPPNGCE